MQTAMHPQALHLFPSNSLANASTVLPQPQIGLSNSLQLPSSAGCSNYHHLHFIAKACFDAFTTFPTEEACHNLETTSSSSHLTAEVFEA
jgi:hypothetical protein